MSRAGAIERIERYFDTDGYFDDLARRIAIPTESPEPARRPDLHRYLADEMTPSFERLGFTSERFANPLGENEPPFLVARRHEADELLTMFCYGHGDVVRGYDDQWSDGRSPWRLEKAGERWYGRGTADNKGQHSINLAAMAAVLAERGRLGFNVVFVIETGEETGSPGLREFCESHRELVAADVLLASDGPRLVPDRPTLFMGTRGALNFDLTLDLREGGHHSGNWGGLLANPGVILAHALASVISASGEILVPELRPPEIPESVRRAIHGLEVGGGDDTPDIDPDWGEPGLNAPEQVFGWNSFEVLAFTTGNPAKPANAVPPRASAHCQIRFVVPCRPDEMLAGLRRHFDDAGFGAVEIAQTDEVMVPTRLDPDHPWAQWAAASIERTSGVPDVVPNLGGSLPNDVFADLLGLPTLWVPHSYAGCSQNAPNDHILDWVVRDGLRIMTGLFWDLGDPGTPP
jgi:acetylornithine deacetylase/succinyl-diaminopimelate desuccinylase-like protein